MQATHQQDSEDSKARLSLTDLLQRLQSAADLAFNAVSKEGWRWWWGRDVMI
jgi:hypothetical protein